MMMAMSRVLVAEDDLFLSALLMRDLAAEKYEARAAYDGVQATDAAREWRPDIMLLDLLMPTKDGFQVLEELRSDPATAGIRIVVLTNLGEKETIDRVKKFNIADYIVKADTTPRDVVTKIQGILG